eukprot:m.4556 g.4556  ORF g.4556 m.4556 type:complete len:965 (-) comp3015_c0_seq1:58-2952(-)
MDPATLIQLLSQTLSPEAQVRKTAEAHLKQLESQPGFAQALLSLISLPDVAPTVLQASALYLMTFVRREWPPSDDGSPTKISNTDRQDLRTKVALTLVQPLPNNVESPICETVAEIGKLDFPAGQWDEILPHLVSHLGSSDFKIVTRVLRTCHELFKRYRHEGKSDQLWLEIKKVLDVICQPLTQLFQQCVQLLQGGQNDLGMLTNVFNVLRFISKLFYSLNFQDLPEFFEDNMKDWFTGFSFLLSYPAVPGLASTDEDKPGIIEELKTQIVENVEIYATKYDEEFQPYVGDFVSTVWTLLVGLDLRMVNDVLISVSMKFLSCVVERPNHKPLFEDPNTLRSICEKVVVPNMLFRDCDEELFEDNYEEYIRRDVEGSDVDTRRRGATDLVRGLCTHFEEPVTQIFSGYIQHLLQEAAQNPAENWKSKDAAIFLVTSLAIKGKIQGKGATSTNSSINIPDFFNTSILPELQIEDVNQSSVLKADALKFALNFRSQLSKQHHLAILPLAVKHLTATSLVVMSYAAYYIERVLILKQGNELFFSAAEVGGFAQELLTNLFQAMSRPDCTENEYLMKAIMRTISAGKAALTPVMALVIDALSTKMMEVSKNPGKAKFNHYMFEAMSGAVRFTCEATPAAVSAFEEKLFPPFEAMLTINEVGIVEFQPYVFQIVAQMLEAHSPGDMSGPYEALFPFLLKSDLWESGANTSPLVRLLQAYVDINGNAIMQDKTKLEGMLGIFQKLCASKTYDHEGFKLVGSMLLSAPEQVKAYIPAILQVCMTRLSKLKTVKFIRGTLWFMCVLIGKFGGTYIIQALNGMQPGLFDMLMNRLLIDIDSFPKEVERKVVAVGLTKLLTETPVMMQNHPNIWKLAMAAVIKVFDLEAVKEEDEENQLAELEAKGYQAKFAKLVYSSQRESDPFAEVQNPRTYFSKQLYTVGQQVPNLSAQIPHEVLPNVMKCLQAAGINALP